VDKVFNRAYNIVWRRYFNESSERDFIIPKAKIAESEEKSGKYLCATNDHLEDIKQSTRDLQYAQRKLKDAQKEEFDSKTQFSKNYNQAQALINRFNSKKYQKSNSKPKVIKQQQTLIDRLEKEMQISSIKETELKGQINNMEDDM